MSEKYQHDICQQTLELMGKMLRDMRLSKGSNKYHIPPLLFHAPSFNMVKYKNKKFIYKYYAEDRVEIHRRIAQEKYLVRMAWKWASLMKDPEYQTDGSTCIYWIFSGTPPGRGEGRGRGGGTERKKQ